MWVNKLILQFRFPTRKVKFWNVLFRLDNLNNVSPTECLVSVEDKHLEDFFNLQQKVKREKMGNFYVDFFATQKENL